MLNLVVTQEKLASIYYSILQEASVVDGRPNPRNDLGLRG